MQMCVSGYSNAEIELCVFNINHSVLKTYSIDILTQNRQTSKNIFMVALIEIRLNRFADIFFFLSSESFN